MAEISPEINLMQIATILNQYRFEMRGYKAQELIERWLPKTGKGQYTFYHP